MSMFPMPDAFAPEMEELQQHWQKMAKTYTAPMPPELAGFVNLMAHPVAGMAAASAIGMGMAGQAFGMWMGTLAGAAEASQRILQAEALAETPTPAKPKPAAARETPVAKKSEAAVRTVIAEARRSARTAAATAADAGKAAKAAKPEMAEAAADVAVAPAKTARPAAIDRPDVPDDLKAISGVGPKLEQVLNGFGIWTYGQVAALDRGRDRLARRAAGVRGPHRARRVGRAGVPVGRRRHEEVEGPAASNAAERRQARDCRGEMTNG